MKQIKCREMGGPQTCEVVIKGETAQDLIDRGWKHLQEAHPTEAKNIMANPKEENDKWMDEFEANFENLEDVLFGEEE